MINALSAPNALGDRALFVQTIRRDQDRNRLANGILRQVPVQPFGAAIPAGNDPIEVRADDGIVGRLDDGRELLRNLLACAGLPLDLLQGGFRALGIADVLDAVDRTD